MDLRYYLYPDEGRRALSSVGEGFVFPAYDGVKDV